ncbi:hypothetical protein MRB53_037524 [Persea americana]|nr:hypothetical protein MRB53_037524 [Persea americana]
MSSTLSLNTLFTAKDLVVVITGGGSGLGQYTAKAIAANGAKAVYVVGRREDSLKATVEHGVDGNIIPLVGDVSDRESLKSIAAKVRKEHGYINALFANAGVSGPPTASGTPMTAAKPSIEQLQSSIFDVSLEDFSQPFLVNCAAAYYTAIAFLDLLDAGNKKGNVPQSSQIIITTSVAAHLRMLSSSVAYGTSKAAATFLMKKLSTGFAEFGIRCNCIAPGLYPSEMTAGMLKDNEKSDIGRGEYYVGAHAVPKTTAPALRTGSEQDFAATALFMVSPGGAYLNGVELVTDGGRLAVWPGTY